MNRYDRQNRISDWRQDSLSAARVMVLGAGAIGNEVLKNMALMGVGHVLIVDFDRIELSNLSRTVLFSDSDIGGNKARAAAESMARLNLEIDVRFIDGDLFFDVGLGFYRSADLVVSCLDSIAARSHAGICCSLAGTPFLDCGMWAHGGEVRWFLSGEEACFECSLTEEDRKRAFERRSCTGFRIDVPPPPPEPASIATTAAVGAILSQEIAGFFCGWRQPRSEAVVYNGLQRSMFVSRFTRDPDCRCHEPYRDIVRLPAGVRDLSAADLIDEAEKRTGGRPGTLFLGRDFLLELYCPRCREMEIVEKHMSRVSQESRACPRCGSAREAAVVSDLTRDSDFSARKLADLGTPPGEVLAAGNENGLAFFEFEGDIERIWPQETSISK